MPARLKVLLVLDHAPDYREEFLRELGGLCDLTVVAQPCEPDNLHAPIERLGYAYVEIPTTRMGGLIWQPGLRALISTSAWSVVCVGINVRHSARVVAFLTLPGVWRRWVWCGHIFGSVDSRLLNVLRGFLLRRAAGCLTYSEFQASRANEFFGVHAVSFNNTEVRADEFRTGIHHPERSDLNLLFVGRFQPRKRLERLIDLAARRPDVSVRLVGPGMEVLNVPVPLLQAGRVERYGKTSGEALNPHFDWADLVANPGHAGLLVMNAARHQKGIVIDSGSRHAPEFWLAKEAGQPFVDFEDPAEVDRFVDLSLHNRSILRDWGMSLQQVARSKYTIEYMAAAHMTVFHAAAESNG